ncbi:MAG TPA: glycosyltransferase family 39 protein [Thermodesulfobacteriota bacterium]|nr:glycosyltransferase family 39 protein [Thermodesulfobacteriota bacterium]
MKWSVCYLLLLFLVSLYGINIYSLTSGDSAPPMWDEAVHLRDSLVYYNILGNPSQVNLEVIKDLINKSEQYPLIRPSGYYPPLVPISTSFWYFVFGTSAKVAIMSNMIFIFILVFSVYKIGTLMFDRNVGLLASVLILLFPIILKHSVIYYLDLPLTAMVALGTFFILKSNYFQNTKFSVISGFCFGLGMLTKWTYLFFVLGPLGYLAFRAFYPATSQEGALERAYHFKKVLRNIALFVLASIVTFGPYYFPILPALIGETLRFSGGPIAHGPDSLLSYASVYFYPAALWNDMITPVGLVLFIAGLVLLLFSNSKQKTLLSIWILIPYCIFTFLIQNKQPRYMMPWLIPISFLISFFLIEVGSVKVLDGRFGLKRYAISLFLILFSILFFRENLQLRNTIIDNSREEWKVKEIVSAIEEDMNRIGRINRYDMPMYMGVIPDHRYINGQTIRYYTTLKMLPLNVIKLQNYEGTAFEEFVQKFYRYDYILTKNSANIAISPFQESIDRMHEFFYSHIGSFRHLRSFQEPDGSEVSLFRKKF